VLLRGASEIPGNCGNSATSFQMLEITAGFSPRGVVGNAVAIAG
jgi:hypothetical protein